MNLRGMGLASGHGGGESDAVSSQGDGSPLEEAEEEVVPLTSTITRLVIESDGSLSGLAFVMLDQESQVVGSESRLASAAMNIQRFTCNRSHMLALSSGCRRLAKWLEHFPPLNGYLLY